MVASLRLFIVVIMNFLMKISSALRMKMFPMNLADRVNLHFKIMKFVDIPFDEYLEMPIVRMIDGCEDFDDVLLAAEALYKFCKQQMQNNQNPQQDNEVEQSGSSSDSSPKFQIPQLKGINLKTRIKKNLAKPIHMVELLKQKMILVVKL